MPIKINGTNTLASPSITGDDTDTGIVYGSDQIDFSIGGASKVKIDSNGDIGINTTTINRRDAGRNTIQFDYSGSDASEGVELRLSNSALNGNAATDNLQITYTGQNFAINNTENGNIQIFNNGSERLRIDSSGRVGIGTTSPSTPLHVSTTADGTTDLLTLHADSDGSNNGIASIKFTGNTGNHAAFIKGGHTTNGDSLLTFHTDDHASGINPEERMRVHSNGRISVGTTSADATLHLKAPDGANNRLILEHGNNSANEQNQISFLNDGTQTAFITSGKDSSNNNLGLYLGCGTSVRKHIAENGETQHFYTTDANPKEVYHWSNNRTGMSFRSANTERGNIFFFDSGVQFNTGSDYRLKENVTTISDGITRIKQLIPRKFNWIIDESNTPFDGFLAHEVSSIVPEAINGTKDAVATQEDVDSGRSEKEGDPIHQMIDHSKLVPLLTAALQEAIAKIEVLETKVAALEAA